MRWKLSLEMFLLILYKLVDCLIDRPIYRKKGYIACYFAKYCSKLEGDFVECGVGQGLLSKTIVSYLNFEKINKIFFLFDTFEGIPIHQGKDSEIEMMNSMNKTHYHDFSKEDGNYYNQVCKTFSNYHNVLIYFIQTSRLPN